MKKMVVMCLVALLAIPAFADIGSEVVPGELDLEKRAAEMDFLHQWLLGNEDSGFVPLKVQVSTEELVRLKAAPSNSGSLLVGTNVALDMAVTPGSKSAVGKTSYFGDRTIWMAAIESPGASAMRLHLSGFNLPEGASLYVYNAAGDAFGPYTDKGIMGNGTQWTHTVVGSEIRLQLHIEDVATLTQRPMFTIKEVAHLGDKFAFARTQDPTKAFCSSNASCIQNASCSTIPSAIQPAANATAHLLFSVGSSQFICTGGLLNDTDASTQRPLLLTANHCFSSSSSASSLEAYFQFTTPCSGSCYNPYTASLPRTVGSTILATGATSDYTLVELSQAAPAGSVLLGWSNTAVAFSSGTNLFRISHPKGSPQSYSTQSVNTTSGTCSGTGRGNWIYSDATFGDTEGGSSGSVVLNSSGQVVGQLTGACGATPAVVCDGDDRTIDGALAAYYSSVAAFLDPGTGGGGGSCTGVNVWTGTASSGGSLVTPNCSASGLFEGDLVCDTGAADLDLHLDRQSCGWFSCSFSAVASSASANCDESITTNQGSGTYRWRVRHFSGPAEDFDLCTNKC